MIGYRYNQCIKYYPSFKKVITFNQCVYNPIKNPVVIPDRKYNKDKNITRNDSLKRSKDKIYDIAILNKFDYFVTFTLDGKKINRFDYDDIQKKLKIWLKNKVTRNNLKYLIVPELHKNGAIHFHGLISGDLKLTDSGHKDKGKVIYNLDSWKYGFTTCVKCTGDYEAVAHYISKYITKDTKRILGNTYYSGGGLERDCKKDYRYTLFSDSLGKEYIISEGLKVKYYVDNIK